MSEYYCPSCSCPTCQPQTASWEEENIELREKVARLQSHIISQDKIIAELSPVRTISRKE